MLLAGMGVRRLIPLLVLAITKKRLDFAAGLCAALFAHTLLRGVRLYALGYDRMILSGLLATAVLTCPPPSTAPEQSSGKTILSPLDDGAITSWREYERFGVFTLLYPQSGQELFVGCLGMWLNLPNGVQTKSLLAALMEKFGGER